MNCNNCLSCSSRCPDYDGLPRHVFVCSLCGHSIYEGYEYVDLFGEQICMDCIDRETREAIYEAD